MWILVGLLALELAHVHAVHGTTSMPPPLDQLQGQTEPLKNCRFTHACPGTCCSCTPGWYGDMCNNDCHINCYTCYSGGECDTCNSSGVFGPLCKQPGDRCIGGMYNRSGCTQGCVRGYFEGPLHEAKLPGMKEYRKCVKCPTFCTACTSADHCNSCVPRRWADKCSKQCPSTCKRCNQQTGTCHCNLGRYNDSTGQCKDCPDRCRSCRSESHCRRCKGQWNGELCDIVNCSGISNCVQCTCSHSRCSRDDIICTKCKDGYTGEKCQINNTAEETSLKPTTSQLTATLEYMYNNEGLSKDTDTGVSTTSKVVVPCVVVVLVIAVLVALYLAKRYSWLTTFSEWYRSSSLFQRCPFRTTGHADEDHESMELSVDENQKPDDSLDRNGQTTQLFQIGAFRSTGRADEDNATTTLRLMGTNVVS